MLVRNPSKDDNGCIFVDRTPRHFDSVLNHMRDGNVVLPDCRQKRQQLLQETRYYLLSPTPKTTMVVISTCMGPRRDLKGIFQVLNANEIPGLVKFIYDQNEVKIKQAIRCHRPTSQVLRRRKP
ncbi:hypothetical protein CRE_05157 [Caenorhabditis remanei]|uniref:Potassium channel tetramerisation-type BTB domain-containing protein n=1 Tax=Caenorhabditis remanei TaxID=31234 RepID=E3N6D2_CAERE|nr:hypothetical protein CRE_05157 [Caenorhabditis remanei]